jgi:hypothetical protein
MRAKNSATKSGSLVDAAKARSGIEPDADLHEHAARLAPNDDFGRKLMERKGRVAPDIDLEF